MADKKIPLIWQIAIGFALGVAAGVFFGDKVRYVEPVGQVFLALLKMLIVPLVFSSLVVGAASIGDPRDLGRIGIKTLILYLGTTAVAIVIGLVLGNIIEPGVGLTLSEGAAAFKAPEAPRIKKVLIDLFPANPIKAAADGVMLQIIIFALFLGVSAVLAGEKGKPLISFFDSTAEAMYKMTGMVKTAPYGVFSLIAVTVAQYGLSVLAPFAKVIVTVYAVHNPRPANLPGLIVALSRNRRCGFQRGTGAALTAFVTRSSAALPVNMRGRQITWHLRKGCILRASSRATINMDGTALYRALRPVHSQLTGCR